MIGRILCALGRHDWRLSIAGKIGNEGKWWTFVRRRCTRCGFRQFNRRTDGAPVWEDNQQ